MTRLRLFILQYVPFLLSKGLVLFISLIFLCSEVLAQGPGGDPEGDPDLVPVDGGLGFLLAAGVGYGVKKVRERRRKVDS